MLEECCDGVNDNMVKTLLADVIDMSLEGERLSLETGRSVWAWVGTYLGSLEQK